MDTALQRTMAIISAAEPLLLRAMACERKIGERERTHKRHEEKKEREEIKRELLLHDLGGLLGNNNFCCVAAVTTDLGVYQ